MSPYQLIEWAFALFVCGWLLTVGIAMLRDTLRQRKGGDE